MENVKTFLKDVFNVTSDIIGRYGSWVVSKEGDIVNYRYRYPIYSYQVNDDTWLVHLRDKIWFDKRTESDFLEAFEAACSILNIKVELKDEYH